MERKENGIFISDEELKQGLITLAGIGTGFIAWQIVKCIILCPSGS